MNTKPAKIISVGIIIWVVFFATDFIRAAMDKKPIFSVPVVTYKDGGSQECYGIGYKVNVYVYSDIERFREIERVDIGTWFMPF